MIIDRLEIVNILSHRRTAIEFPRGVVAIVGQNGAGKTSIVDAISYALFGTHSRDARGSRQSIIRLGASAAQIQLEFSVAGRRYRIVKRITRTGPTASALYLVEDGGRLRALATSVRPVEAELAKIFGMPLALAEKLYITRQGELDSILVKKKERLDLLNSLLRLKDIETAYEVLGFALRDLRREREMAATRLETRRQDLARLQAERRELEEARRKLEEARRTLEELRDELEKLEKLAEEERETRNRLELLNTKLQHLRNQVKAIQDRLGETLQRLSEAQRAARELEELRPLLDRLPLLEEAHQLLLELRQLEESIEKLDTRIKDLEAEIGEASGLEEKIKELDNVRTVVERLEAEAINYEKLKQRVEDTRRRLSEIRSEAERLRAKIETRTRQVLGLEPGDPLALGERLLGIKERLEESIEKARLRKENLIRQRAQLEQKRREIEKNLEKLTSAEGVCPLCKRPLDEAHRLRIIQELRAEKRRIEADLQRLQRNIALIESEIRELEDKKKALERLLEELRGSYERLRLLANEEQRLEQQLEELNQRYLMAFTAYKEYEEARSKLRELEKLSNRLEELRVKKKLLRELREELGRKQREAEEKRRRIAQLAAAAEIEPGEIEEALQRHREAERRAARLEALAGQLGALQSEAESLKAQLEELLQEEKRINEDIQRLEERLQGLQGSGERLEEARKRFMAAQAEISRLQGIVEALERRVGQIPLLEAEVKRLQSLVERYDRAIRAAERIRSALGPKGLQRLVRVKARNVIEYHLRDMLYRFNLDFVDVRLDDDYEAVVVTREGEKSVNMLSGGERIALAIAYRLALARAVGGRLGSLVMDEPTVHLDEERRRELVNIIRYGLEATGLGQLIVITHDSELEEAADHVLEVRKENGVSVVVPREPLGGLAAREAAETAATS